MFSCHLQLGIAKVENDVIRQIPLETFCCLAGKNNQEAYRHMMHGTCLYHRTVPWTNYFGQERQSSWSVGQYVGKGFRISTERTSVM